MKNTQVPGLLLVANWESSVGYAWWLMESYWTTIARQYGEKYMIHLAYPLIQTIPTAILETKIECHETNFRGKNLTMLANQCQFIKRHNIKTIYFSDAPSWQLRYLIYRLCGVKKIIVHDHTPGNRLASTGLKKIFKTAIHRFPWIRANAMIATTKFVQNRHLHVNCFPPQDCHVVTNGIPDATDYRDINVRKRYQIPKNNLLMVMTGRANRYKGVDFALTCLASVIHNKLKDNIHFLFLGDGPDLDDFRDHALRLNITNYTTLPGKVNNVPSILKNCDFAFHPSRGEVGYSLSILEYMQNGLPVIVPNNPSVCGATVNGETGITYQEDSIEEASAAIVTLLEDHNLRKEMGLKARTHQQKHFDLENSHRELLHILSKVIL
jgi:glycosyltransferase involved in cell wall biosynthesis